MFFYDLGAHYLLLILAEFTVFSSTLLKHTPTSPLAAYSLLGLCTGRGCVLRTAVVLSYHSQWFCSLLHYLLLAWVGLRSGEAPPHPSSIHQRWPRRP